MNDVVCHDDIMFFRNWKNGEKIASFNLNESLLQPECVQFSPLNWRNIVVAYKQEITVWSLEIFDNKRVKTNSKRFQLPPTNDNIPEQVVGTEFKEEFKYPYSAIAYLKEPYASTIDEVLDRRQRHSFKSLVWLSGGEILVCTNENLIFKVNYSNYVGCSNRIRIFKTQFSFKSILYQMNQ